MNGKIASTRVAARLMLEPLEAEGTVEGKMALVIALSVAKVMACGREGCDRRA